ncbi:MBL fold metallo-hydrolase [Actinoalloteichus sp. AHMU CJ021]|uniref:Glyoxylase, beta-lactamase superfamily II n=1 Tax=Actinoalloteichus caeruleus DSM 43889 TaxID=1120930 RepID=A0ABT1JJ04_ACTCY|nr:MBL fold metallo-hydrolase [Actinoalloteichus caeruleus]AUS78145.1 MBL fold metallo-hydrolase [Actinoalloteichus sp. AHMU CJ021]MCP2332158.1 Glyoxylase, beta-lactamase superfamily II [Actinoalloteichus caeruleus DSM 43889]
MLRRNVADGIHRVEHAHTNWFIVEDDDGLTVVDAGLPTSWEPLRQALADLGRRLQDVEALVLTHGHFDHLGFAERMRSELGVPVLVHDNDVPLTRHPRQYGRSRPLSWYLATQLRAAPLVAGFVRNRAWWPKPVEEVHRIRDTELVVPGGPRVLYTPGHTLGHCAFHFPERDAVIAGDAVVTLNPYRGTTGPQIVSGAATVDPERALESLDAIAETSARTVLVGHGDDWTAGAERLVELARRHGPS